MYPEWRAWAISGVARLLSRFIAAFQIPTRSEWQSAPCSSLFFLDLDKDFFGNRHIFLDWEVRTWSDPLLMVVAHTVLLGYGKEAVRARFQRCLERLCRADLVQLIQCLRLQPRLPPEEHNMVQQDVFAAFAAYEPYVSQSIEGMSMKGRRKVANAVAHIMTGTARQLWDRRFMDGFAFVHPTDVWWLIQDWDVDLIWLGGIALEGFPKLWVLNPEYCSHELPEPSQRSSPSHMASRLYTKHQRRKRHSRGTLRQKMCISDFSVN